MSYCRWSSDDFRCDVYTYEDSSGGWTTHVAGRRRVFDEPLPPHVEIGESQESVQRWVERGKAVREIIDRSRLVDIGLKHDGATFNDATPGKCADRLEMLRKAGYIVPQYAIDALREEEAESEIEPNEHLLKAARVHAKLSREG